MAPPYSPPRHRPWMRRRNNRIIAAAAEDEGSERADQEPGGEGSDRLDERASGGACREELDRQECRQTPENVEVVPLDHVPDCRGDNDTPKVLDGERGRGHISLWSVVEVRAAGTSALRTRPRVSLRSVA